MLADRQGVGAVLNTNTLSNGTDSEYVINGAHYGGSQTTGGTVLPISINGKKKQLSLINTVYGGGALGGGAIPGTQGAVAGVSKQNQAAANINAGKYNSIHSN